MRDYELYLQDIFDACRKIEKYTRALTFRKFREDELVKDAVIRNLEIIGEASKHIPPNAIKEYSRTEWQRMTGLRNILIHEYFGVDEQILWDIVMNKVPQLKRAVRRALK